MNGVRRSRRISNRDRSVSAARAVARGGPYRRARARWEYTARVEEIYQTNTIRWLDTLWSDLVYAVRFLGGHPGFTTIAILTLALGIGANAAVFSVIDNILLKPLAYPHAEEVIALSQMAPGAGGIVSGNGLAVIGIDVLPHSYRGNRSFQAIGVWTTMPVSVTAARRTRAGVCEPRERRAASGPRGSARGWSVAAGSG